MEALLHFTLIFSSLYILGFSTKKAFIASIFAPLADLDVLFGIHRWFLHSILIILAVGIPLVLVLRRTRLRRVAPLALFAAASHPLIDAFCGYTPLLWPISEQSLWVKVGATLTAGNSFSIDPYLNILIRPTDFSKFVTLEGPIFTGNGLIISALLIAPVLVNLLRETISKK